MARRANPTLIGGFVVGGVLLTVVGLVVLRRRPFLSSDQAVVAYFEASREGRRDRRAGDFQGAKIER